MSSRGSIAVNKVMAVILIGAAIILGLMMFFNFDILKIIKNIPDYSSSEPTTEDYSEYVEVLIKDGCGEENLVGVINSDKGKITFCTSIGSCRSAFLSEMIYDSSTNYLKIGGNKIGELKDDVFAFDEEILQKRGSVFFRAKDYLFKLNYVDLLFLNGSRIVSKTVICSKETQVEKSRYVGCSVGEKIGYADLKNGGKIYLGNKETQFYLSPNGNRFDLKDTHWKNEDIGDVEFPKENFDENNLANFGVYVIPGLVSKFNKNDQEILNELDRSWLSEKTNDWNLLFCK